LNLASPVEKQKKPIGMSRDEWKRLKRETRDALEKKRVRSARAKIDRAETEAERVLARQLAAKKVKFEPQYRIGDYSVDFYIRPNIVVEVNGGVHRTRDVFYKDKFKKAVLEKQGYVVLSFSNLSVLNHVSEILHRIMDCRSRSARAKSALS
jgi:very-short-patch-repair endonuclease